MTFLRAEAAGSFEEEQLCMQNPFKTCSLHTSVISSHSSCLLVNNIYIATMLKSVQDGVFTYINLMSYLPQTCGMLSVITPPLPYCRWGEDLRPRVTYLRLLSEFMVEARFEPRTFCLISPFQTLVKGH